MKSEIPTPRTESARITVAQRTDVTYLPEMVLAAFARQLERELTEANDKLTAALMLCAENGINVKSITVAAMPNISS